MALELDALKASGIVQTKRLAQLGVLSVINKPGLAGTVLGVLARQDINVHFVVETIDHDKRSHFVLCVDETNLEAALLAITSIQDRLEGEKIIHRRQVALVSVFGPHFRDVPGAACLTCASISAAGAEILAISTSFSSVTCLIEEEARERVIKSLREVFNLPESAVTTAVDGLSKRGKS